MVILCRKTTSALSEVASTSIRYGILLIMLVDLSFIVTFVCVCILLLI